MTRLIDFIEALKQRGRNDEAELYKRVFTELLEMTQKIPPDEAVKMTIDAIEEVLSLPPKPSGWDNFTWGKAAFNRVRDNR